MLKKSEKKASAATKEEFAVMLASQIQLLSHRTKFLKGFFERVQQELTDEGLFSEKDPSPYSTLNEEQRAAVDEFWGDPIKVAEVNEERMSFPTYWGDYLKSMINNHYVGGLAKELYELERERTEGAACTVISPEDLEKLFHVRCVLSRKWEDLENEASSNLAIAESLLIDTSVMEDLFLSYLRASLSFHNLVPRLPVGFVREVLGLPLELSSSEALYSEILDLV
jgi:hypothetical protein